MTAGSVVAPFVIPIRIPVPGKAKHEIDTETPIQIKSGLGESSTLKYTEPIRLPSGKVNVRAMAVSRDGRQSAVVTKVFIVDSVPSELQEPPEDHQESSIKSLEQSKFDYVDVSNNAARRTQKGPRFLSQRSKNTPVAPPTKRPQQSAGDGDSLLKNLNSTQISRLQRETDFLRCFKCLSHRPSDPFARFCLHCGAPVPPIPGQRLPPTEGGQGKLVCPSCGAGNPAHLTYCVTCETRLSQADSPVLIGQRAPPLPSSEGKMVSCSKCNRLNHSDARFCDWCGAKPGHAAKYLTCSKCGASSHPYANFCGSCGVFLEGPPRGSGCSAQPSAGQDAVEPEQSSTIRHAPVGNSARRVDAQTQTAGIFYPSSADLQKRCQQREAELSRQGKMSDRKPLLTAVSPGRGFWRKQLDHICAHLRSYTQNNSEFRALVGEPRMGRLISAVMEEDSYEVSLHINFVLASPDRSTPSAVGQLNGSLCEKLNLSDVTEGRNKLITSKTSSATALSEVTASGINTRTRRKSCTERSPGANPSYLGSHQRPPLIAAVLNGHHDVIPMLVQKGADVDQLSGPMNNGALHEAAALGTEGLRSAEILLGCNASLRKLNNHGQTPYDVAEASGCSSMISLLATHTGRGLLNTRSSSGLDTFS
ncbi:Double zinc ribbon and ankyrin repeat-containing protein 1 [Bagarius yarrelli]|uniref:Double zinc ribbon and ankyrin repeat-containing protein 1 n=1 Tax=Bagarius yarrelli TaxID=175774 RepID=A0A556TTV8_BAGYA|nr:Double zinc ribbon and ankyrin repeat-containing protein 1 [Bagarius yarrelli]